jgi:hypothetical protein
MNATPHYDLLPLMWWENPWIVGTVVATISITIVGLYSIWRIIRARKNKPVNPREQWLADLQKLQTGLDEHTCTIDYIYQELMRIMRDYAHVTYSIHDISHTDEEFMTHLRTTTPAISTSFLNIVEKIKDDVYEAKFAHALFPAEHVQTYIRDLMRLIEQEKKQSPDKNT